MTENNIIFVLLAIDTNPDPASNEIWAFRRKDEAEKFLRGWAEDFLGGYTHDVDNLPPDAELVTAFRNAGAHVHLYECHLDGGSREELTPFERAPEPQPHGAVTSAASSS
jgi:hypothetical protein